MPRWLADREESFLELLNARLTVNSGATFSDGDGVMHYQVGDYDRIGVEVKATDAKSYSLKKETWEKINREARRINLMPIMGIDISGERLVVMDANDFMSMLSFIEGLLKSNNEKDETIDNYMGVG